MVNEGAEKAGRAAAGFFKKAMVPVAGAADQAGGYVQEKMDARAQAKAHREARRALCDGAGIRMSAATFLGNWDADQKAHRDGSGGYLNYCGCYAITTYSSSVRKDDYGGYRDVYVGSSSNMGASIHADLVGLGNIDVNADVKYKQTVYVLLYPCPEERVDQLRMSLITALDADASYNKESLISDVVPSRTGFVEL